MIKTAYTPPHKYLQNAVFKERYIKPNISWRASYLNGKRGISRVFRIPFAPEKFEFMSPLVEFEPELELELDELELEELPPDVLVDDPEKPRLSSVSVSADASTLRSVLDTNITQHIRIHITDLIRFCNISCFILSPLY